MRRVVAFALSIVVVACGVPIDTQAEELMVDIDSPAEVDEPDPEELESVSVYLVRDDHLVHATRDLPFPAEPDEILVSLFEGLTAPEERADLRTSIPPGTRILGMVREGEVLRLDLSRDFAAVGGEEEILAVAQIVLTATSIDGLELVAFQLDGVPTDVPVASGALSVEPVGSEDYLELTLG